MRLLSAVAATPTRGCRVWCYRSEAAESYIRFRRRSRYCVTQSLRRLQPVSGIPSFWLTCMKNAIDGTNDFITDEDEPILEHLTDVVIEDGIDTFKLHFHFGPNDFFRLVTRISRIDLFVSAVRRLHIFPLILVFVFLEFSPLSSSRFGYGVPSIGNSIKT